ncbi:hypothetical protein ACJ4V0_15825 [Phreatobacter sp. HK31-P]
MIDANRNRLAGSVRAEQTGRPNERWVWSIIIPSSGGTGGPPPNGAERTRAEALQAMKAAWLAYDDRPDWPPLQSASRLSPPPLEGMGPWRHGEEPRGWKRAGRL